MTSVLAPRVFRALQQNSSKLRVSVDVFLSFLACSYSALHHFFSILVLLMAVLYALMLMGEVTLVEMKDKLGYISLLSNIC